MLGGLGAGKQGHPSVPYKGSGYCYSLYPLTQLPASSGRKPEAFSCLTKPIISLPHLRPVLHTHCASGMCLPAPPWPLLCPLLGAPQIPTHQAPHPFPHRGPSYSNASLSLLPPTGSETLCLPITCQLLSPSLGGWCLCPSGTLIYSGQGT